METLSAEAGTTAGMRLVPGGSFRMGSTDFYPEEAPVVSTEVGDLWVDVHVNGQVVVPAGGQLKVPTPR